VLARLAKLTEKPTPNLLPTKDTWPTLLCSSTHTNPACPGNSGNETYDTSGPKNIVKLALKCRHDVFVSFSLS